VPANTNPNFTAAGDIAGVLATAAWAESEAGFVIGTSGYLAFTAGANGSWVDFARIMGETTSAGTGTTATVGRIWISSIASGTTTTSNTFLWAEVALPAVTAASSSTPVNPVDVPLGFRLPASYTILFTIHAAAAANTAQGILVIGSDY
jgi:hypothetical protein